MNPQIMQMDADFLIQVPSNSMGLDIIMADSQ
jgi:hypothetical protein